MTCTTHLLIHAPRTYPPHQGSNPSFIGKKPISMTIRLQWVGYQSDLTIRPQIHLLLLLNLQLLPALLPFPLKAGLTTGADKVLLFYSTPAAPMYLQSTGTTVGGMKKAIKPVWWCSHHLQPHVSHSANVKKVKRLHRRKRSQTTSTVFTEKHRHHWGWLWLTRWETGCYWKPSLSVPCLNWSVVFFNKL